MKREDFKLELENRRIHLGDKSVPLADWWIKHPDRRQYTRVIFDPGGTPEGCFNLFRGWPVQAIPGDCDLYLDHLKYVICAGNDENFRFLIALMAHSIQHPSERIGICIVMRGDEGTGKGTFAKEYGALFGPHFITISNGKHLVSHFNAHFQEVLIVFADEAFWAGDKECEGILKSLITDDKMMVERKGIDAQQVQNNLRFVIATNNSWAVPAGLKARRFLVLDVSDTRRQDTDYFGKIAKQMVSGGREALMHYLRNYDLSEIDLRQVPKTAALLDNKLQTLGVFERWLFDCLDAGCIGPYDWHHRIATEQFYRLFVEGCRYHPSRSRPSEAQVGKKLSEVLGQCMHKTRSRDCSMTADRTYYYNFDNLEECRKKFTSFMGQTIEWSPVVQDDLGT